MPGQESCKYSFILLNFKLYHQQWRNGLKLRSILWWYNRMPYIFIIQCISDHLFVLYELIAHTWWVLRVTHSNNLRSKNYDRDIWCMSGCNISCLQCHWTSIKWVYVVSVERLHWSQVHSTSDLSVKPCYVHSSSHKTWRKVLKDVRNMRNLLCWLMYLFDNCPELIQLITTRSSMRR
jgi:hypothetical protein